MVEVYGEHFTHVCQLLCVHDPYMLSTWEQGTLGLYIDLSRFASITTSYDFAVQYNV